jgi:hypothetical protein
MSRSKRLFAFRLALALGISDVDAMLADMPVSLLDEWRAYFDLEPWGHPITERRHVDLCILQGGKPRQVSHVPSHNPPQRFMTARETAAKCAAIRGAHV